MKFVKISATLLVVACLAVGFAVTTKVEKMQAKMEIKVLADGKHSKLSADVAYDASGGRLITKYTYPTKYYVVANNLGEIKVFVPDSNQVRISQNNSYSTEENLLFLFLNNHQSDLRLKSIGCSLLDTKFDGDLMISYWKPPAHMSKSIGKIELVHRKYDPIYICYYGPKFKPQRKVYFSKYKQITEHKRMPMRMTEIMFLHDIKDSVITKTEYSELKLNNLVDQSLLKFTVPADAEVIIEKRNEGQ